MRRSGAPTGWRNWFGAAVAGIVGIALRLWFVTAGSVEDALRRSDTLDYLQYAFNLLIYHTFSKSHIADGPIVPDSFRDPGYPSFLAGLLLLLDFTDRWYAVVLVLQAIVGGLTAGFVVLIARRWLTPVWSLAAGLLTAIWPHCVAFSAYVLSETLFGFLLVLALWLSCRALDLVSPLRSFAAGCGFGLAVMVNAVVMPLAPLLALLLWKRGSLSRSLALALLLGALVLPAAWALRGWSIPAERSPQGRAAINLVQGSWPEYHHVYIAALAHDPATLETMQAIGREQDLILRSPTAGLASVLGRLRAEPWRYLRWYASKPLLLWAWHIRMGWGDIYAYPVDHSIYLSNPVMPAIEALCFALNPLLFLLMAPLVLALLVRPGLASGKPALYAVAVTAAFATLVYSLLQAEPRYSVPLRPLEMLLAVTALRGILNGWRCGFLRARHKNDPAAAPPSADPRTMAPGGAN